MKNKQTFKVVGGVAVVVALSFLFIGQNKTVTKIGTPDEALLAIIKNDQHAFEKWVQAGGDLQSHLPEVDGKKLTVAEGIVHFNRTGFLKYLKTKKKPFVVQDVTKDYDIVSIAAQKNDPELLKLVLDEKPQLDRKYGKEGWTLLHMASAQCADKNVSVIHKTGMNWDVKAKDGTTPLTLAAAKDCLAVMSYWKDNKADFKAKDANGKSTLGIIQGKKDPVISAFAVSFAPQRKAATEDMIPSFYNKRKFPKDRLVEKTHMLEPEDRPEEAYETADYSEFSD